MIDAPDPGYRKLQPYSGSPPVTSGRAVRHRAITNPRLSVGSHLVERGESAGRRRESAGGPYGALRFNRAPRLRAQASAGEPYERSSPIRGALLSRRHRSKPHPARQSPAPAGLPGFAARLAG